MHGDFTRDTYDPTQRFTRVLLQQGRLLVDADWNEQTAIFREALRELAADVIGWHGGVGVTAAGTAATPGAPTDGPFTVFLSEDKKAVKVRGSGRYYVDGIAVAGAGETTADNVYESNAPDLNRVVYLDVWERHVTSAVLPGLPDPAFGGADTSARAQLVARVRTLYTTALLEGVKAAATVPSPDRFRDWLTDQVAALPPEQRATIDPDALPDPRHSPADADRLPTLKIPTDEPADGGPHDCDQDHGGGYTGLENQLYRVEIHQGGRALWDGKAAAPKGVVTFKWSRDNGSLVYPVRTVALGATNTATLWRSWADESRAIRKGDWIELLPADAGSGTLAQADDVRRTEDGMTIVFSLPADGGKPPAAGEFKDGEFLVRRWDQVALRTGLVQGAVPAGTKENPIHLEDGIAVSFATPKDANGEFRAGDYWLIPARADQAKILWPSYATDPQDRESVYARYTSHHYVPLAYIDKSSNISDLRKRIPPAAVPAPAS